jgi:hypothetical protein
MYYDVFISVERVCSRYRAPKHSSEGKLTNFELKLMNIKLLIRRKDDACIVIAS